MKISRLVSILLVLTFFGCSDDIQILEERIKTQAELNNTEISSAEIKKTALYLNAWSKKDFYKDAINEFLEEDKLDFPKEIEVLFTGSSSIRFWNSLEDDMQPLKVLNRGFGGAHISHVNHHFEDVIQRYSPKAIVFFCGTNDLTALKTPKETIQDFEILKEKVHQALPGVHLFVIGIKPSPARVYLEKEEIAYNEMIAEIASRDDLVTFIDIWDAMLSAEGERIPDLFIEDGLHINAKGYEIWTKLVREHLKTMFTL